MEVQNVVTNAKMAMCEIQKTHSNYKESGSRKFKFKSKSRRRTDDEVRAVRKREEEGMRLRLVEETALSEKEARKATIKKRAGKQAAAKKKQAEQERRRGVEEYDRKIRELELQRSRLLHRNKAQMPCGLPPSLEGTQCGQTSFKSTVTTFDLSKVKQVSKLSNGKVNHTPAVVSSDASGSITCSDPLLLGVWEKPTDIPPIELNSSRHPTGRYWEHLSNYAFKRAAMTFPTWNLSWPKQSRVRKTLFIKRLKELYPGGWDSYWMLCKVGANIRQRRVRMRNNFRKFNRKENAPLPAGLALDSWNAIYDSLSHPKYKETSGKCKVATEERSRRKSFSHKLGPKGVARLIQRFVSEQTLLQSTKCNDN
jgi:hypothetical protein